MRTQHFAVGDIIFSEGDPSAYAYVVETGRVEIFREQEGRRWVLGAIGPGEIFGEMGLVDERPRSAGAQVVQAATVSAVTGEEFVQALFDNSSEGLRYLKALFERLRAMNDRAERSMASVEPQNDAADPSSHGLSSSDLASSANVLSAATDAPIVTIHGITSRAARAVSDEGRVIDHWPFRVGRSASGILGDNHLELDDQQPYTVSRNHFLIDRSDLGVLVRDRGSYLGTVVNGEKIGGRRHNGEVILTPGENVVIAGKPNSTFRFRVHVKI